VIIGDIFISCGRDDGLFVARLNVDGSAIGGVPLAAGNNRMTAQTISGTVAAILIG